jgi:signal transduction histidine kinase
VGISAPTAMARAVSCSDPGAEVVRSNQASTTLRVIALVTHPGWNASRRWITITCAPVYGGAGTTSGLHRTLVPAPLWVLMVGGMAVRSQPPRSQALAGRRPRLVAVARDFGFVASGPPLSAVALTCFALCPLLLRHRLRTELFAGSTPLAITVAVVAPTALLVAVLPGLTAAQRWRFSALAGISLDSPDPSGPPRRARSVRAWLGREATWRQFTYHLVVGPILGAASLLALGMLGLGLALCLVFFWISAVKGTHPLQARIGLTVAGLALVGVVPWTLRGVRRADTRIGAGLLGPNQAERLLADVTESRKGLVTAADAERRRIERDLHDGAQARLVSLAMNLGLARATRTDLPHDALAIITEAQDEAIKAIDELRDLIRGFHPAVLDDLGLDAALSALVARMPVPVGLHVNIRERASSATEAVAYFIVSEALTNIAKHASASSAAVAVDRTENVLKVVVTDDGTGGADPSRGSGINGLARRARSVDGTFHLDSPPGGPTIISVELPCES